MKQAYVYHYSLILDWFYTLFKCTLYYCRYAMIFRFHIFPSLIHRHLKSFIYLLNQPWCSFGGLDMSSSNIMRNADVQTIYTETLNVTNQGRLEIRCPFNLHLEPLYSKDFPRLDKAFFTIYGMNII